MLTQTRFNRADSCWKQLSAAEQSVLDIANARDTPAAVRQQALKVRAAINTTFLEVTALLDVVEQELSELRYPSATSVPVVGKGRFPI